MNNISVITPTYNEEASIVGTLEAVSRLVNPTEIIIVDGGSTDRTVEFIKSFSGPKPVKLIETDFANRGRQLHEGTRHAAGDIYWFLHADTRPKQGSGAQILKFMKYDEVVGGNFEVLFSGGTKAATFLSWLYPNLRKANLVYGDSAFFVRKSAYEQVGGYKNYPLFEDVDLFKRLLKRGTWKFIPTPVETSSRRFEGHNFAWVFTKWSVRQMLYWFGVSPRWLGRTYRPVR